MHRRFSIIIIIGLALVIWGADQWSKRQVLRDFELGESVPVIEGYFNLTYVQNTGAAMGLLVGHNVLLTVLSIAAIAALIFFRHSFVTSHREHLLAMGMIIGGILGNLTDRLQHQFVVDFLHFHWQDKWHYWVFNIADAAICVGVFSYVLALLFSKPTEQPPPKAAEVVTKPTENS